MTAISCLVCNKSYDGTTHCSVTVCRACAMFFRRCETWETIPFCKLGSNSCKLKSAGRVACSFCRYQKCVDVGLKRRENARSFKCAKDQPKQIQSVDCGKIKLKIDLPFIVPETMPTLKRFCYHYAVQSNHRREYELGLLQEDGEELVDLPGNRKMALMKQCRSEKVGMNCHPQFVKFLLRSFPILSTIDSSSQEALILRLMFYFFDLFCSFQTWKIFNDVNTTKIVCSEVMFADFDKMNTWIGQDIPLEPMDLKVIQNYMDVSWRPHLTEKQRLLHRINITDVEYLAASALVIWDEEVFACIPQLSAVAESHRNLIYKDLEYYYRNVLHLDNYVERVINLKELIKSSKKTLHGMSESVNFLRTFNYYKNNEEMWAVTEKIVKVLDDEIL